MEIKLTGHRVSGIYNDEIHRIIQRKIPVFLRYVNKVSESYNPNPGFTAVCNNQAIGWIKNDIAKANAPAEFGFAHKDDIVECVPVRSYTQETGYLGLIVVPKSEYEASLVELEPKTQPQAQEKQKMKVPSIQDIVTSNIQAASNAARLEVGSVANKQLVKIVAKRLPAQYGVMLNNPFGKLLLANAVMVAAKSMYPENKNLGSVSNAMVVDSYQELIKSVDISGIIDELMADTKVVASLKDEDNK